MFFALTLKADRVDYEHTVSLIYCVVVEQVKVQILRTPLQVCLIRVFAVFAVTQLGYVVWKFRW